MLFLLTSDPEIFEALGQELDIDVFTDNLRHESLKHLDSGDIIILDVSVIQEWSELSNFIHCIPANVGVIVMAQEVPEPFRSDITGVNVQLYEGADLLLPELANLVEGYRIAGFSGRPIANNEAAVTEYEEHLNISADIAEGSPAILTEDSIDTQPDLTSNTGYQAPSLSIAPKVDDSIPGEKIMTATNQLGKVVAFASARIWGGGVGKTTLAMNLAAVAGKSVKYVALLELDPGGPLKEKLRVSPNITLSSWVMNYGSLNNVAPELVREALTDSKRGFSVLLRDDSSIGLSRKDTLNLISQLRTAFDLVIIDLAGSLSPTTLAALDTSDYVYMVASGEKSQLETCSDSIQHWIINEETRLVDPAKVKYILNAADKDSVNLFTSHTGQTVFASLPNDRQVYRASERKELIVLKQQKHPFTLSMIQILQDLGFTTESPVKTSRWGRGKERGK